MDPGFRRDDDIRDDDYTTGCTQLDKAIDEIQAAVKLSTKPYK